MMRSDMKLYWFHEMLSTADQNQEFMQRVSNDASVLFHVPAASGG
jgi:hypothetical protein